MFDGYVTLPEGCWPFVVNQPHDNWRVLLWIEGYWRHFQLKIWCFVAWLHRRGVHNSQPTPFLRMGPSKEPEWSSPRWLSKTMFLWVLNWPLQRYLKSLKRIGEWWIWTTRFQSAHLTKTRPTFLTKLWNSHLNGPLDFQLNPLGFVEVHM